MRTSRALDVVVAGVGLVVLSPVLVVLAVLVRLRLGSPVLFRQVRPGLHGELFTIHKFRTMTDARGPDGDLLPDEQRLTPFGRWLRSTSLDELPELINVLKGDMSLSGPRPLLMEYLDRYTPRQARRHDVRPGITGWAQINGRNDMSWEDKLELDVWYVEHRSLWLDLEILARTALQVMRREGISRTGHATAPEFLGSGPSMTPEGDPMAQRAADRPDIPQGIGIRPATEDDRPQILELLRVSLGLVPNEQYASFYRWKHEDNPFGPSPAWVAVDGDRIAGLRVWLRWEFTDGGRVYRAVRAVDTATHPDHRGQGIFTRLTLHSLGELVAENVDFVFNTPNDQSRPGYLKMGWQVVGRPRIAVRFASPAAAFRTAGARVAADKWSLPSDAGIPAHQALDDGTQVRRLLAATERAAPTGHLRTRLDPDVLRWRYGFPDLHYRAVADDDGLVVFRVRRRGPAEEAVICVVLAPDRSVARRLVRRAARESGADHAIHMTSDPLWRAGFLPLPGQGPILTWRSVTEPAMPPLSRWRLSMGDIELF